MSAPNARVALAVLALALLGWILPGERVLQQVARARETAPALGVEASVSGVVGAEDAALQIDLHPDRGVRLQAASGERWLVRGARVLGAPGASPPSWIPWLDILTIRAEGGLLSWLAAVRIDPARNGLARCGEEEDCFVLGGLDAPAQLWIEKERFEVRRYRSASGRVVRFEAWAELDGVRFPGVIEVEDPLGPVARLEVRAVGQAPELERADFGTDWLRERPADVP